MSKLRVVCTPLKSRCATSRFLASHKRPPWRPRIVGTSFLKSPSCVQHERYITGAYSCVPFPVHR